MCMVIDKIILPLSFQLQWGKEGDKKGERNRQEHTGTPENHHSEAASKKIANTYLCWGQF